MNRNTFQPEGNTFNKYESSGIMVRRLMNRFFSSMDDLLEMASFNNVYEGGCGEGFVSAHIHDYCMQKGLDQVIQKASDISKSKVTEAAQRFPEIEFETASLYKLPEIDNTYDLVVGCEVLEHMEQPNDALKELMRVSKGYVLVSVPNEPIWRILNMLRGKYWRDLGNTPGHVQHWSKAQFLSFVKRHGDVICVKKPFPWTMVLLRKR